VVETSDSAEGRKFKQTFRDNMTKVGKPEIKPSKQDWTKITWAPDLAKFGMEAMDDDIVALMERRAYDMAGCTHSSVKVRPLLWAGCPTARMSPRHSPDHAHPPSPHAPTAWPVAPKLPRGVSPCTQTMICFFFQQPPGPALFPP
jgi:hypothetical protein